jgi:hypothetical protein
MNDPVLEMHNVLMLRAHNIMRIREFKPHDDLRELLYKCIGVFGRTSPETIAVLREIHLVTEPERAAFDDIYSNFMRRVVLLVVNKIEFNPTATFRKVECRLEMDGCKRDVIESEMKRDEFILASMAELRLIHSKSRPPAVDASPYHRWNVVMCRMEWSNDPDFSFDDIAYW